MQDVSLNCTQCGEAFIISKGEHARKLRLGKTTFFCSLSCGTKHQQKAALGLRQAAYAANPIRCLTCSKPLLYETRNQNKYCSHSCAARHTNTFRIREKKVKERKPSLLAPSENKSSTKEQPVQLNSCRMCGKPAIRHFCSCFCQQELRRRETEAKFMTGQHVSPNVARRALVKQQQGKCAICGISTWQDKPVLLILDHIDGNAAQNILTNLRLVCSNCDATLPTYKGRNKGKGRFSRKKRYQEGKSY